jgi:ATP-binding cassette, subfamily B (MDR/TAP), member 1
MFCSNLTCLIEDLVQLGTSEKIALVCNFTSSFFTGMILAYVRSWRLALALTSMIPCIAITGGIMNKFGAAYKTYVASIFVDAVCR